MISAGQTWRHKTTRDTIVILRVAQGKNNTLNVTANCQCKMFTNNHEINFWECTLKMMESWYDMIEGHADLVMY